MSVGVVLLLVAVAVVATVVLCSVRVVPADHAVVVGRPGRPGRAVPAGLGVVVPFVEQVRAVVDLAEQTVDVAPQSLVVDDGRVVAAGLLVRFTVTDPVAATDEVSRLDVAVEQLAVTAARSEAGSMTHADALAGHRRLASAVTSVLAEALPRWGARLVAAEVTSVEPHPDGG